MGRSIQGNVVFSAACKQNNKHLTVYLVVPILAKNLHSSDKLYTYNSQAHYYLTCEAPCYTSEVVLCLYACYTRPPPPVQIEIKFETCNCIHACMHTTPHSPPQCNTNAPVAVICSDTCNMHFQQWRNYSVSPSHEVPSGSKLPCF